ncbi:MAG: sugar phosphate isomerase/epimerase [Kiritimatiellaeota bacterium]|nr:sugar phosphate isomerase/epimerase [Kiritimatiellota bacterium]
MTKFNVSRRSFVAGAVTAGAAVTYLSPALRAQEAAAPAAFKTQLRKALLADIADEATCERIAKAGFPGVELMKKGVSIEDAYKARQIAERFGVKIHSFMGGWAQFNHDNADERKKSIEDVKQMIRLTSAYGASTILLVPCRIGGAMPKPSQFKIDFDPATLQVSRVVDGDNAPFADYIKAQNTSTELSRQAVEELLPVAAEAGVVIALENVWNNLWVLPDFAAAFVRSFKTPWVQAYLDLGNHVRYAPTEDWLKALKGTLAKLHIKDFLVNREKGNDGDFVPIGKGSIDWVSVRKVIEEVGYHGWVSIESGGYTDAEHSRLMDNIFAGKGAVL